MSKFIEINPNVNRNTVTTVEITLGMWEYRSRHLVKIFGNVIGFSAIESAICDLEENIERHPSGILGYQGQECIYLYDDNSQLEVGLDGDQRFQDLVVSAVIIKQEN